MSAPKDKLARALEVLAPFARYVDAMDAASRPGHPIIERSMRIGDTALAFNQGAAVIRYTDLRQAQQAYHALTRSGEA